MTKQTTTWNLSSRVHSLNQFPNHAVSCFVKRDDELSAGISGTKYRKYASLMPYVKAQGFEHLILIAGPQSNNLLAALQMARAYQLQVTAFLIKPWNDAIVGNFKLSSLFLKAEDIIWVERNQWSQVEDMAHAYSKQLTQPAYILPEGASVMPAFAGAQTLAEDIIRNEDVLGWHFDHIFIDAGTGFTAAALIKGLADCNHPALVHVLLLADDEKQFQQKLNQWTGADFGNYRCLYPRTAKAFGAVNKQIWSEIQRLAQEEGLLSDPIYSAKLFHTARNTISQETLTGKVLIIHSGGILSTAHLA